MSATVNDTAKGISNDVYVANTPLEDVRSTLRSMRDSGVSFEGEGVGEFEGEEDANLFDEQATDDGTDVDELAATAGEEGESEGSGRESQEPELVPSTELKRLQEQFQTLSANMHRVSQERRNERAELARLRAAEEQRFAQEQANVQNWIRQLPTEEQRRAATEAYRANVLQQALGQYANHVEAREYQTLLRELGALRANLPQWTTSMAEYVAEQVEAPKEAMTAIVSQQPFQELLAQFQHPRELMIIGEVLHAAGLVFADQEKQRKGANRKEATSTERHRTVRTGGVTGGLTAAQKIEQVKSEDWEAFREKLRKTRNLNAALS